ncbi:cysteine hydrolase family protein [Undibacterium flavidum]|uniref:Cysteine hydrolase n=1 Tax=Undibacterium flavidum TaxID=2762297 RepID=A0ABR6Y6C2_9BURK|nr:cysteine hydrolase family protein [Undibacterium flavidum]MBC3872172.1 cysteine hydrolase [Undibacterium flavidum]
MQTKHTALLLVDVQQAFDHPSWGARNNPQAEQNIASLLGHWRARQMPVIHIRHFSVHAASTLHPSHLGVAYKTEAMPITGEKEFTKSVNSALIGTGLEDYLHQQKIDRLVIVGISTDHCVSTTTRMAGNLGFTTYLVSDACATFDRRRADGKLFLAEDIHQIHLCSLDGEFCTVRTTAEILSAE